jgi:hypothetical protein
MRRLPLALLLLSGCGHEAYCESGDLFPGMWSGWLYHTEGIYILQDEYTTPPCDPYRVEGHLDTDTDGGFVIDCLSEPGGTTCIQVEGGPDGVVVSYSVFLLGTWEAGLGMYEEIGERQYEDFVCLN